MFPFKNRPVLRQETILILIKGLSDTMIISCQKTFYFMNSNLIPATENEQPHAGFLTADTAGQRDDFFFSTGVSQLEMESIGRT